ncbi:MAG TPA: hypothetical protein VE977_16785, partial [Pyrinomonadaceae bacterium]|nr:hypothetical protein [Pyrinomonadaceae bacterium]
MKKIKLVLIIAMILGGLSASGGAAQGPKSTRQMSPRALVADLYRQHKKQSPFFQRRSRALLDKYFARELANLLWQDAHSAGDEVGALD